MIFENLFQPVILKHVFTFTISVDEHVCSVVLLMVFMFSKTKLSIMFHFVHILFLKDSGQTKFNNLTVLRS